MFNLKTALAHLDQEVYYWDTLKLELSDIIWDNRIDLPPGFYPKDLLELAFEYGYIKYDGDKFKVDLT